jgi:hypothetical protein
VAHSEKIAVNETKALGWRFRCAIDIEFRGPTPNSEVQEFGVGPLIILRDTFL